MNYLTRQNEVSAHLRHQLCFREAQKKEQSAITEKKTREGFTLEVAFELDLRGLDARKGKKSVFWLRTSWVKSRKREKPALLSNQ